MAGTRTPARGVSTRRRPRAWCEVVDGASRSRGPAVPTGQESGSAVRHIARPGKEEHRVGVSVGSLPEFLRRSPYHRLLGLEMVKGGPDEVVVRMPFRDDLLAGDDADGRYIHGGAIASLIDTAGDFAVIAAVGYDVPTIDLRVDYLRPATGALVATARPRKVGRSLAVADIEVTDDGGTVVAVGRGVFKT